MQRKHEDALSLLIGSHKLEGDFEGVLQVQGKTLDGVQVDVDYIEANLLPDKAFDEEILSRWESLLGLPVPSGVTIEDRREQIIARLAAVGGLSRDYFERLANTLGYVVQFTEPPYLFRAGISRANDPTIDPLLGFRALANSGSVVGGLVASSDRSDRELHVAHNDRGENLRVYNEGEQPRKWAFGMKIIGITREEAEFFISLMLELKPVETFIQWEVDPSPIEDTIDEGDGLLLNPWLDTLDEGDGVISPPFEDAIDEGDGIL